MQKSHDQSLSDPKDVPGIRYLIQLREPTGRIASEIERMRLRRGGAFPIEDRDFAEWWLVSQAIYEEGFRRRWLAPAPAGALILDYGDLLQEPQAALERAIRLFGCEPEADRVADVVARNRSRTARSPGSDHELYLFRPRGTGTTPFLPPDLLAEFVGLSQPPTPTPTTRLARLRDAVASLALPDADLTRAAADATALRNANLAGLVRKRLLAAGRDAEALTLKRAFKPPRPAR